LEILGDIGKRGRRAIDTCGAGDGHVLVLNFRSRNLAMVTPTGATVWRDYITDGVPASGANEPDKAEIRDWAASLEAAVQEALNRVIPIEGASALLPPLPLMARPRVILCGDSTMMQNNVSTQILSAGAYPNSYPRELHRAGKGFATWAAAYSEGRWTWNVKYDPGEGDSGKFFSGDNAAFAAEPAPTVLDRLPRALRLTQPQIAIFAHAINDLFEGCPASIVTDIADIDTKIAAICVACGCYPVFTSLPGRSPKGTLWPIDVTAAGLPDPGWDAGDPRYLYRQQINANRKAMADASNGTVFFADFESVYVNSSTGYWNTLCSEDGIHPSMYANQPAGKKLADVLNPMISTGFAWERNVSNFNYLTAVADPTFTASGGTAGNQASGTVGDGWTVSNLDGSGACSVACSLVTITGASYKAQRLIITLSGSNVYEVIRLRRIVARPKEPAGTRFKMQAFATWTSTTGGGTVTPFIERTDITDYAAYAANQTTGQEVTFKSNGLHNPAPNLFPMRNAAETDGVWLVTEAVELVEGTTSLQVGVDVYVTNVYGAGGTFTVDISQPKLFAAREATAYTP
jgi:hypothetical protein